ncbi:MAG: hypothetical protein GX140_03110 [Bacteroidales bacterium]|jgi:hypothetical protein|nr:hypothetical protein [Bacteroidales bacterium]
MRKLFTLALITLCMSIILLYCGDSKNKSLDKKEDKEAQNSLEFVWSLENLEGLEKSFGKENLSHGETSYDEGNTFIKTTTIFAESDHPLTVIWDSDDTDFSKMFSVKLTFYHFDEDYNQRDIDYNYWQCENGLRLGMTIGELREWAEKPFKFFGIDWDFGGYVDPETNPKFENYSVFLGYETDDYSSLPKGYNTIAGDVLLDSDNELANELPLTINTIEYSPNK